MYSWCGEHTCLYYVLSRADRLRIAMTDMPVCVCGLAEHLGVLNLRKQRDCDALTDTLARIMRTVPSAECTCVAGVTGVAYVYKIYHMITEIIHLDALYSIPTNIAGTIYDESGARAETVFGMTTHNDEIASVLRHAHNTDFEHMCENDYVLYVAALMKIYAYTQCAEYTVAHIRPALDVLYALPSSKESLTNSDYWCMRARHLLLLVLERVLSVEYTDETTQCAQTG